MFANLTKKYRGTKEVNASVETNNRHTSLFIIYASEKEMLCTESNLRYVSIILVKTREALGLLMTRS